MNAAIFSDKWSIEEKHWSYYEQVVELSTLKLIAQELKRTEQKKTLGHVSDNSFEISTSDSASLYNSSTSM